MEKIEGSRYYIYFYVSETCTFDSINFLRDGKFLAVKNGKQQLYDKFGHLLSDYSDGSVYYSTSGGVRGVE